MLIKIVRDKYVKKSINMLKKAVYLGGIELATTTYSCIILLFMINFLRWSHVKATGKDPNDAELTAQFYFLFMLLFVLGKYGQKPGA